MTISLYARRRSCGRSSSRCMLDVILLDQRSSQYCLCIPFDLEIVVLRKHKPWNDDSCHSRVLYATEGGRGEHLHILNDFRSASVPETFGSGQPDSG